MKPSERIQTNGIKNMIDSGETAFGIFNSPGTPRLVEYYGLLGLDWVWIDFEHKHRPSEDGLFMEHLTRAADCGGTEVVVRLPAGEPPLVRKVLDSGVRNVVIPRVRTAREVREAVEATKFLYDGGIGERGGSSARARAYGTIPRSEYYEREDENVLLGIVVEHEDAVDNLDEILSVPDLGFATVGTGDLSNAMGHHENRTHPEVQEMTAHIFEKCAEHGVPTIGLWGVHFWDPAEAARATERHELISIGSDTGFVASAVTERLEAVTDPVS